MGKRKEPRMGKRKEPRMVRRKSLAWKNFTFSQDNELAFCKDCGSQFVAKTSAGTSHIRRHKNSCIGRLDGATPPPGASNWEEATAVLARQDGAPLPIASPPTTPAAPPLGALPESSSSNRGANWDADLARTISLHGFDPSFAEDGAPPIAPPPDIPAGHLKRQKKTCSKAANRQEATAPLARQDGAPSPITLLPTIPAAPPLDTPPESSSCSKAVNWEEEATADLARMIALHGYDPSFVEDSYFRSFVRKLSPDFQVPSRAAVEDICDGLCDEANEVLESELERTSVKVNVAIDTAETAQGKVLYAACHFIDEDWKRRLMILDIYTVVPGGMGRIPLHFTSWEFDDYDMEELDKTIDMTIDHLSVPDRVFSKAIVTTGDLSLCLQGARYETAYNHNDALQMVASCFFDNVDSDFHDEIIWDSLCNATRQELGEFYSQLGLDHLLAYDKKWISFYFWLKLVYKREGREDCSSPIPKSKELMCNVFGEVYRASKTICDPNRPTSNIVLRELFKVRETLQSLLADATGDEADLYEDIFDGDVVDALEKAEQILDQSIEEEYLQWSIPLVLDPRYKLKHMKLLFIRAFSSKAKKYIANITKEIKELFTSFSMDGGGTTDEDQIDETQITSAHQLELDRYLQDPLMKETEDFDILNWWKLNSSNYPTLARMARAALAMPTSSKLSSEQMSQITSKIRGYTKGTLDWY